MYHIISSTAKIVLAISDSTNNCRYDGIGNLAGTLQQLTGNHNDIYWSFKLPPEWD